MQPLSLFASWLCKCLSTGKRSPYQYAQDANEQRTAMYATGTTQHCYDVGGQLTGTASGTGATIGFGYTTTGNVSIELPGRTREPIAFVAPKYGRQRRDVGCDSVLAPRLQEACPLVWGRVRGSRSGMSGGVVGLLQLGGDVYLV